MTKDERQRFAAIMEAAECLFVENLALKVVMEYRAVPNWQKLVENLMKDEEILAGVELKFRDLLHILEHTPNPSVALQSLLGHRTRAKRPH